MSTEQIGILIVQLTALFVLAFLIGCCGWIGFKLWRETRGKKDSDS